MISGLRTARPGGRQPRLSPQDNRPAEVCPEIPSAARVREGNVTQVTLKPALPADPALGRSGSAEARRTAMEILAEGYNVFETDKSPTGVIKYLDSPKDVIALIQSGKLKDHILLVRGGTTTFLAPALSMGPPASSPCRARRNRTWESSPGNSRHHA